jgi:serine/threonine protein kinase/Tol biopolymer transport system component
MDAERWKRIDELLQAAIQLPVERQEEFLRQECGDDCALLEDVQSLLASHRQAGDFLQPPATNDSNAITQTSAFGVPSATRIVSAGQVVSHYRVIGQLGSGGMGVIYRAEDIKLGRRVAMKFLPSEVASDHVAFERLQREARAASALDHPNICSIYELGEHEGQPFIVMQLLEGGTLQERIANAAGQPLPTNEVLDLAVQIVAGLEAAHEKGIIHRDVKPANVFVTSRREAKILDFGLAKLIEEDDASSGQQVSEQAARSEASASDATPAGFSNLRLTRTGTTLGTAYYMSPEQVRGEKLDARTDLFSFGLVLYEMSSGQRAFAGDTAAIIHDAILHRDVPPIRQLNAQVPAEFEQIIGRALEKDRERRYQSASEVRTDLLRLRPDAISSNASAVAAAHWTARNRLVWAGLVTLLIVLGGVFWGLYSRLASKHSRFQRIEMTKLTTTGKVTAVAISRDGKYVAYAQDEVGTGTFNSTAGSSGESLWVRQVSGGDVQLAASASQRYGGLIFSPDGEFLYFVQSDITDPHVGSVYKQAVLGGTARRLAEGAKGAFALALSPDGKQLAFIRRLREDQAALIVMNADGGGEKQLYVGKPFTEDLELVAWSPDGKNIVTCLFDNEGEVHFETPIEVDVESGRKRRLTSMHWRGIRGLALLADGRGLIVNTQEQLNGPIQVTYLSLATGEAQRITNDLSSYKAATLTADSRTLATVQITESSDIWAGPVSGPESIRPVTSGGVFLSPAWTPDGKIVYAKNLARGDSVWIMDADGSQPRQLALNENSLGRDYQFRVSPDGRFVVLMSARTSQAHIWRMDIDGNNTKQLTSSEYDFPDPLSISPDGKWVLYSKALSEQGIWKVPIEGGNPVQLNSEEASTPVVSPDGKTIAYFYQNSRTGPPRGVAIMPITGGAPIRQFELPHRRRSFHWASDSQALLFVKGDGAVSNVWSQPISGGTPKQITRFNDNELVGFDLSRDGKQLVLTRARTESDVVLIRDIR